MKFFDLFSKKNNNFQNQIEHKIFDVCNSGIEILEKEYKILTAEGKIEVIIFNSLSVLDKAQTKYHSQYKIISHKFFALLLKESKRLGINMKQDKLIDIINSRYQFFDSELNKLYSSKSAFPGGIYNVFYENPLIAEPTRSFDLVEIITFYRVLGVMMNSVDNQSNEI